MESELNCLICIGGSAGTGKTTLASVLAGYFNVKRASFSDVLRDDAKNLGVSSSRANLQDLGIARIQAGWSPFVEAVTRKAGWPPQCPAVIEGIRHPDAIRECRRQAIDLPVLFVFLEAHEEIRGERIAASGRGRDDLTRATIDSHEVEQETADLRELADLILEDGSLREWLQQVIGALGSLAVEVD